MSHQHGLAQVFQTFSKAIGMLVQYNKPQRENSVSTEVGMYWDLKTD